ncbi:MAG: UDP-N-acetylmuramate--L-alanine ligase [Deltaproteobacteria bacterium]|nr:UDP-N-acetylmuramate--L-alanine ligase [Deltaproteobacteria bacterium]
MRPGPPACGRGDHRPLRRAPRRYATRARPESRGRRARDQTKGGAHLQRKLKRLHFVGIGGIGMAGLAELLHAQGMEISGSDLRAGATTERLESLGIEIALGHDASRVGDAQAVIRSSAIPADNPELVAARAAGLPIVSRGALLAEVMRTKDGIAVAGSHGKTTTTALVAHLLDAAGLDPTALVGGRVPRPGGFASPAKLGSGDLLVAEVDESDGSFLWTRPVFAIVTNVDPEHLDHYGTREALLDAFVEFANAVPFWGAAVLGIDHPGVRRIRPRIEARQLGFGFDPDADLQVETVESAGFDQRFRLRLPGGFAHDFELPMPGRHNVLNATAAIAIGLELDVPPAILAEGLSSFPGVARRFERKGRAAGIDVVDDYAHHPAEIRAVLAAARSVHAGPVTAVFQPHRYTRTRDCWSEFLEAFEDADRVLISDVYAAGEDPIEGIDGAALADAIGAAGHPGVDFGGGLARIAQELPARLAAGELVLTLGAGDIVELGQALLAGLGAARGASGGSA